MKKVLLFFLFLLFFLLRAWRGPDLFFWHVDEEIIALTVKRIVVDHRPQLIGFPIPGGIYLGPLFYYVVSIFYVLSEMDPTNLFFFSAILGTLTVFLVYKVGNVIFENKKIGGIAAVLYGLSYLADVYSRLFSGLTFVPLLSLFSYYLIHKAAKTGKKKYILGLGALILASSQNEATSLSLVVLVVFSLLIFKIRVKLRIILFAVFAFLIFQLPLLVFDLRHNHYVLKSFLNFLALSKGSAEEIVDFELFYRTILFLPTTAARFLFANGPKNIADQILPCGDLVGVRDSTFLYPLLIPSIFAFSFFIFSTLKRRAQLGQKIICLHLAIIAAGIGLYNLFLKGYLFEWMLVLFFPAISFIYAYLLKELWNKNLKWRVVIFVFLFIFAIVNVRSLIETTSKFGLRDKIDATRWTIGKVEGRPFELVSIGSCYAQGYVYLFWQRGHPPVKSYADDMFSSTLNLNPKSLDPQMTVVMVNPSGEEGPEFWNRYNSYRQKADYGSRFGGVEVLIVED